MWRFLFMWFVLLPLSPLVAVLQLGCMVVPIVFVIVVFVTSFPS